MRIRNKFDSYHESIPRATPPHLFTSRLHRRAHPGARPSLKQPAQRHLRLTNHTRIYLELRQRRPGQLKLEVTKRTFQNGEQPPGSGLLGGRSSVLISGSQ